METALHEQLGSVRDVVGTEVSNSSDCPQTCFEPDTLRVQNELITAEQNEIQGLRNDLEQMKLQQELSVRQAETASTSSTVELKQTISGLQNEVSVERVWNKSDQKWHQEIIQ